MAIFKCKMCGGTLEVGNESVAVCAYCGTQQTLPKLEDDKRINLYDRANHFRRNNEFDKAKGIYEQILNDDPTDAEAYWSLVLCNYGIEYVEDPNTFKRVPTVNRTQFISIFQDDNYKSALQYADSYQRQIYETEAKTINEIQKGILAISQKEEPFDVFICYKETDNNGNRTPDSVLANDLYHQLTQEGFKVFFSRITLEDKLGSAYEPYIFAALNSAKVMVVLGTKAEYFNAVWVKNEWSRYLSLTKQGQQKMLIPAYKDMDPYDLPEEFSHLQAQDLSKLGFMQDLIRGIKKLTQTIESTNTVLQETVVSSETANVQSLLKRVFLFLEDGDWENADAYCERVLDIDPENAQAYLGKLMAKLRVKKQAQLAKLNNRLDKEKNYQKVIRFADVTLKETLINYNNEIIYKYAERYLEYGNYQDALSLFEEIPTYLDVSEKVKQCQIKRREQNQKCREILKGKQKTFDRISAGDRHTVGLKADGTVVAVGDNGDGQCDISGWKDIVAISAGYNHTVGLKADGTVVATGRNRNGQCNVSGWKDIVAVSARWNKTVGLKVDGTVVAVGDNESAIFGWKDIVAVSLGYLHTVGLKADGTVVATGENVRGQCNVSGWKDIVAVSVGRFSTVGLKSDGSVVVVGSAAEGGDNKSGQCNVSRWKDIVAISAGDWHTVGLKADGTVVATGENRDGQCAVDGWKNIPVSAAAVQRMKESAKKRKQEEEKKREELEELIKEQEETIKKLRYQESVYAENYLKIFSRTAREKANIAKEEIAKLEAKISVQQTKLDYLKNDI